MYCCRNDRVTAYRWTGPLPRLLSLVTGFPRRKRRRWSQRRRRRRVPKGTGSAGSPRSVKTGTALPVMQSVFNLSDLPLHSRYAQVSQPFKMYHKVVKHQDKCTKKTITLKQQHHTCSHQTHRPSHTHAHHQTHTRTPSDAHTDTPSDAHTIMAAEATCPPRTLN